MCLSRLVALIPALFAVLSWLVSSQVNQAVDKDRPTANYLVVLSGILAALAIFIPLSAGLIPDARPLGWQAWFLMGALLSATVCLLGIVFCMITLQDTTTFQPKNNLYVPGWINASWITLGMLALATLLIKAWK
jgi:protein-S-isoprenylcysteine O-methyltransferase Ste14